MNRLTISLATMAIAAMCGCGGSKAGADCGGETTVGYFNETNYDSIFYLDSKPGVDVPPGESYHAGITTGHHTFGAALVGVANRYCMGSNWDAIDQHGGGMDVSCSGVTLYCQ